MNRTLKIFIPALCIMIALTLMEFSLINKITRGHFTYTLDDAYIHLAMAENIYQGHYGINLSEASSPSSNVLWPFLLVPTIMTGLGHLFPLFLNIFFCSITVLILSKILNLAMPDNSHPLIASAVVVALMIVTNQIGLIFTGMEHSLQVMLSLAALLAMILESRTGKLEKWAVPALILGPLIRYENAAITLVTCLYLIRKKHYKTAILVLMAVFLLLGSFSFYLHSLGLSPMPSSTMAKSKLVRGQFNLLHFFSELQEKVSVALGSYSLFLLCFFGFAAFSDSQDKSRSALAYSLCLAIAMHFLAGRNGWFYRYEIYIWTTSLAGFIYIFKNQLHSILESKAGVRALLMGVCLFVTLPGLPYLGVLVKTPIAASNIYRQQYQMHRFLMNNYKAPVAANDIGYICFRNPNYYVLDLWGLGSSEALKNRLHNNEDPSWMDSLCRKHNAGLAMIYTKWYRSIPEGWKLMGRLKFDEWKITPAYAEVDFYCTQPGYEDRILTAMKGFSETLPARVSIEVINE